jgi:outer membrane protein assembly factor BamB
MVDIFVGPPHSPEKQVSICELSEYPSLIRVMRMTKIPVQTCSAYLVPVNRTRVLLSGMLAVMSLVTLPANANSVSCAFAPHLTCSDAQSGKVLWHDARYSDPENFAIERSQLYISHSTTSSSYDAYTGTPAWQVISDNDAHYFYPVVRGESVYLARSDGTLEKRQAASGKMIWSRSMANGWVYPPLIRQDKIITGGQNRKIWVLDSQSGKTDKTVLLNQELVAPLFQVGELFIASTFDSQLNAYSINLESGEIEPVWQTKLSAPAFSYLTDSRYLIAVDMGGNLSSVDIETGRIRWQKTVHQNALFWNVFYKQSLISLTESGSLNILDVENGQLQNSLQLDHQYIQAPIVHGDTVALYDITGAVQHINPDTLKKHPIPPLLTSN